MCWEILCVKYTDMGQPHTTSTPVVLTMLSHYRLFIWLLTFPMLPPPMVTSALNSNFDNISQIQQIYPTCFTFSACHNSLSETPSGKVPFLNCSNSASDFSNFSCTFITHFIFHMHIVPFQVQILVSQSKHYFQGSTLITAKDVINT